MSVSKGTVPFETLGYVVVEGALDAGWVAALRRAFEEAEAQASGTQHVVIDDATPERQAWERLREHSAVLEAARQVLGESFHVRDLHGRNPLPGFGQQGLHADWMDLARNEPYAILTAIFMLDDFTPENGATRVVPGSHLRRSSVPKPMAQPNAHHPDEVTVTGRAGSVLIFNGHTWHSGTKNLSARPRRAAQMVVQRGPRNAELA